MFVVVGFLLLILLLLVFGVWCLCCLCVVLLFLCVYPHESLCDFDQCHEVECTTTGIYVFVLFMFMLLLSLVCCHFGLCFTVVIGFE